MNKDERELLIAVADMVRDIAEHVGPDWYEDCPYAMSKWRLTQALRPFGVYQDGQDFIKRWETEKKRNAASQPSSPATDSKISSS